MSQMIHESSCALPDNLILRQAFGQHRAVNRGIWQAEFFGVCAVEARTRLLNPAGSAGVSPRILSLVSIGAGEAPELPAAAGGSGIWNLAAVMTEEEETELKAQLEQLRQEHRDLDAAIEALQAAPGADLLQVQRLKKRKLHLRDRISFIEDQLTPDIIA